MRKKPKTYAQAGVHLNRAGEWTQFLKGLCRPHGPYRKTLQAGVGPFAATLTLPTRFGPHPLILTSCDGVGSKLKYPVKHPKNLRVLGQDLVAMNVNDVAACGGEPFFFLDYLACGVLHPKRYAWVLRGMQAALKKCHTLLVGGETAEMPLCYGANEFDLAGFCVGLAHPQKAFHSQQTLRAGDVLIGLPSTGIHSNGFSLVQQLFSRKDLEHLAPEFYRPTALYAPLITGLLKKPPYPKGAAHITGGGLPENVERILPKQLAAHFFRSTWALPSPFIKIQQRGKISDREMFRTFNMGIGFVLAVAPRHQAIILKRCRSWFPRANIIGKVLPRRQNPPVVIES